MALLCAPPDAAGEARPLPPAHNAGGREQIAIRCAFMRGGSSRGGFFLADDIEDLTR
jgi:hypothetical protein